MEGLSKKEKKRERTHGTDSSVVTAVGRGVSGSRRGYGGINGNGKINLKKDVLHHVIGEMQNGIPLQIY